jgi:hypothetical protein
VTHGVPSGATVFEDAEGKTSHCQVTDDVGVRSAATGDERAYFGSEEQVGGWDRTSHTTPPMVSPRYIHSGLGCPRAECQESWNLRWPTMAACGEIASRRGEGPVLAVVAPEGSSLGRRRPVPKSQLMPDDPVLRMEGRTSLVTQFVNMSAWGLRLLKTNLYMPASETIGMDCVPPRVCIVCNPFIESVKRSR